MIYNTVGENPVKKSCCCKSGSLVLISKSPLMALIASGTKIQTHETPDSDSTMSMEESTVPGNNSFNEESRKSNCPSEISYSTVHGIFWRENS